MEQKLYDITIEGQYYAKAIGGSGVFLKYYRATFVLPSLEGALSQIVKHLLAPKLLRLYPDYTDYRTHEMVEVRLQGEEPDTSILKLPIEKMSFEQLSDFCVLRGLMCDPYKADGILDARKRVADALQLKQEEIEYLARVEEENAEKNSLLKLNDIDPKANKDIVSMGPGTVPIPVEKQTSDLGL